jgi:hypothetical protein
MVEIVGTFEICLIRSFWSYESGVLCFGDNRRRACRRRPRFLEKQNYRHQIFGCGFELRCIVSEEEDMRNKRCGLETNDIARIPMRVPW